MSNKETNLLPVIIGAIITANIALGSTYRVATHGRAGSSCLTRFFYRSFVYCCLSKALLRIEEKIASHVLIFPYVIAQTLDGET